MLSRTRGAILLSMTLELDRGQLVGARSVTKFTDIPQTRTSVRSE